MSLPEVQFNQQQSVTTAPVQIMAGRQAQEVQMAMYVAKQFPRDENAAYARIMQACHRTSLAETAIYEYPRGGQKVSGPSIRLAEVLARSWGNIDFGVIELEQKSGESSVMAYAWDLETNVRQSRVFTVKHERKAKGNITRLDDPRDIYEMIANQGARRVRACILGIIPGDVVDAAVEECKKTLINGNKEPLADRIRKMVVSFQDDFQVTQEMLEKYIGCKASAFSEQDFVRLKGVYRSLRDGMAKREDYFDVRVGREVNSNTEEQFKQAKERKAASKPQVQASEVEQEGGTDGDYGASGGQPDLLSELESANI